MNVYNKYQLTDEEVENFTELLIEICERCNAMNNSTESIQKLQKIGDALKGAEPINTNGLLVTKNSLILESNADASVLLRLILGNQFTTTLN